MWLCHVPCPREGFDVLSTQVDVLLLRGKERRPLPAMTAGSMTQDNLGKLKGRQANVTVRPRSLARCFSF